MPTHRTPIPKASRDVVLARAAGKCEKCLRVTDRFEIDHVLPVAEGGDNGPGNLRALCVPCHRIETRKFMRGHTKAKRIGRKLTARQMEQRIIELERRLEEAKR